MEICTEKNGSESKERQILNRSRELIFMYGIKSLTMDDIAQHLGISKKTLYQVVANKADLVEKVLDMIIADHFDGVKCSEAVADNAIDEMLKIYQRHSMMIKRMNLGLTFELRKYFPESWLKLENFRNDFIYKTVHRNLEKGKAEKLYRSDFNTSIIAKFYSGRVLDLINPELFPMRDFQPDALLHEMFLYHIHGVASAAGLKYLEEHVNLDF